MKSIDIKKLIKELTLEEKAGLCSGADFWHTKAVERLDLPDVMVSDGPHGLRKQDMLDKQLGLGASIKAVCFPTASALACSFDIELLNTLGCALGDECQAEEVSTLLGPAVNMKRSPLCGRNFEYLSEDPYLAGELASSYVNGVQSKNIGTSVKHYAANNQETRRMSISSEVDERTIREIYLTAFETIVKKAQPWTMMCSYNCINGVYSCENDWLLNKVLREEWGFQGLVMTDWGAMNDRVKAVKAGLDLEMPSANGITDNHLVEAVKNGTLSLEVLDLAVERVLTLVKKFYEGKSEGATYDLEEHHSLARKLATECAVLLKNDAVLPLKETAKVAFIGEFAATPRFQGGGSSHINCFKITSALEASKEYSVSYAKGFDILKDESDAELVAEAVKLAKASEVAVIFAGLPDHYESEGYDRNHLDLPACQNTLIEEVVKVQPNTIVVLHNGSPVVLPWADKVKGILEVYLSGQAVGESTVDLLYGKVNPSGKLAETFPKRLQDNPSYLNFPGTNRTGNIRKVSLSDIVIMMRKKWTYCIRLALG
ncbi:MAG: glycoside hydrolase family 3 C-terminal domain-containing protein [Mobilitalea sp.]